MRYVWLAAGRLRRRRRDRGLPAAAAEPDPARRAISRRLPPSPTHRRCASTPMAMLAATIMIVGIFPASMYQIINAGITPLLAEAGGGLGVSAYHSIQLPVARDHRCAHRRVHPHRRPRLARARRRRRALARLARGHRHRRARWPRRCRVSGISATNRVLFDGVIHRRLAECLLHVAVPRHRHPRAAALGTRGTRVLALDRRVLRAHRVVHPRSHGARLGRRALHHLRHAAAHEPAADRADRLREA